jgi:hypothetical protein
MPLDVLSSLAHQDRVVAKTADAGVACRAQKIANLPTDVVVIDVEGSLTGRSAANGTPTVLSRELGAIHIERDAIEPLAERVPLRAQIRQRRFLYLPFWVT